MVFLTFASAAQAADVDLVDQARAFTKRDLFQLRENRPHYGSTIALGVSGALVTAGGGIVVGLGTNLATSNSQFLTFITGSLARC